MRMRFRLRFGGVFALGIAIGTVFGDYALAQTPYFQGKTITIYRGGEPGGSGGDGVEHPGRLTDRYIRSP